MLPKSSTVGVKLSNSLLSVPPEGISGFHALPNKRLLLMNRQILNFRLTYPEIVEAPMYLKIADYGFHVYDSGHWDSIA